MSVRVSPCRRTTLSLFFPKIWQLLSCSCGHFSVLVNATVVRFAYALSACQVHLMKKRTSVSPDQRVSSIFSTWAPDCASFLPFQCRARTRIRTFFAGGERTDIPRLVLSPILEPFRTFLLLLRRIVIRTFSYNVDDAVVRFAFALNTTQVHTFKKRYGFLQINLFH